MRSNSASWLPWSNVLYRQQLFNNPSLILWETTNKSHLQTSSFYKKHVFSVLGAALCNRREASFLASLNTDTFLQETQKADALFYEYLHKWVKAEISLVAMYYTMYYILRFNMFIFPGSFLERFFGYAYKKYAFHYWWNIFKLSTKFLSSSPGIIV